MTTTSDVSVGLMHELTITACKAGWETKDFTVLAQNQDKCSEVLAFLRGNSELKVIQHVIDCHADPTIPYKGWTVQEHLKQGQMKLELRPDGELYLNAKKVVLHLSEAQQDGKVVEGHKLHTELLENEDEDTILNANVLDYLLAHPELIPESWKKDAEGRTLYVFFHGTTFRDSDGYLCVRSLSFFGGQWSWSFDW